MRNNKGKSKLRHPFVWGIGIAVILFVLLALLNGNTNGADSKVLTAVTNEELTEFLEGQSGFLYVGRPTCPVCREFLPKLERASEDTGQLVYYYNTDEGRKQDEQEVMALMNQLEINSVPALLYIENGKETDRLTPGTMDQDSIVAFIQSHIKKL
ncbi:thioredoxin family protein [Paenibacillus sp. Marseille-Q4541]|uniref:thioredoxin family protein n=1 Tax=Paenibacillus sp. Marseille-Q4541 TaxID=2831522 RepID=UPI001BABD6B1|nr:thioredoxin family protein [Paenibacillus sp. Marseille-Q4541]